MYVSLFRITDYKIFVIELCIFYVMSRFRIAQKITFLPWFDLRCSELHDMFKVKINNILPIYLCRKQHELA